MAPTSVEVEITTGTNEITFYYEKRTNLSYTVNYLEKETNNVLEDAKVVENQTFGDKITEIARKVITKCAEERGYRVDNNYGSYIINDECKLTIHF